MGMLMAPGMWPEANSEGERTSMSWALALWAGRSATVIDGDKIRPMREERSRAEKDSGKQAVQGETLRRDAAAPPDSRGRLSPHEFSRGGRGGGLGLFRQRLFWRRIFSSRIPRTCRRPCRVR